MHRGDLDLPGVALLSPNAYYESSPYQNTGYFTFLLEQILPIVVSLFFIVLICWSLFMIVRAAIRAIMRQLFRKTYHLKCDSTVIVGFRLNRETNSSQLTMPRWQYENKNRSRDKRRKNNKLIRGWSRLEVGPFKIKCRFPEKILWLVRKLRNGGVFIELGEIESLNVRSAQKERHFRTAKDIYRAFRNDPFGFESYCAWLFTSMGYKCETTRKTADGGFDVKFIDPTGKTGIMECKCYSDQNVVGRTYIDKFTGVNAHEHAERMVFVTTSRFSSGAKERAAEFGIDLIDGEALGGLINELPLENEVMRFADITWQQLDSYYPPDVSPSKSYF